MGNRLKLTITLAVVSVIATLFASCTINDENSITNTATTSSLPATPINQLIFTKDYFPGTLDPDGNYLGGTEVMWLCGYEGKLYAGNGYITDVPGSDPRPGAQILRKDGPDEPWRLEHQFPIGNFRVECLVDVTFTTDYLGHKLPKPVTLLVASPSVSQSSNQTIVSVRNNSTGIWENTEITADIASSALGVRAIGTHIDSVTGIHYVFAGLNSGGILRGSYDPSKPFSIQWDPISERNVATEWRADRKIWDYSRALSFAECNGDIYMSSRITLDANNQHQDGGLYRRVDGENPKWELVSTWPVDLQVSQSRYLRGLQTVPDPKGGTHQVMVANFEYPGLIGLFDPTIVDQNGMINFETELDLKIYFKEAWKAAGTARGCIAAYNRFLPIIDPITGQPLWIAGAWADRPGSPNPPDNGSCFIIRHQDGSYDWGYIYDYDNPVPAGQKLTGCRDIEPSPFTGEEGRVFYFCGYDGGNGPSHNTGWIYRGE